MDCHREYTAEQTDTGQMRNESTGSCYNVHLGFVFSNTWPGKAEIRVCIHSGFIIYLNKTKTVEWKGTAAITARARRGDCGYLQKLLSSQTAFYLFASLKCQSTAWGPCAAIWKPDWTSKLCGIDKWDNSQNALCCGTPGSESWGTAIVLRFQPL